jgi:starch phosphorylase
MEMDYTSRQLSELISGKLMRYFGREPGRASKQQFYKATCFVVRDIMAELWLNNHDIVRSHKKKQVFYLSMEFLPGASLRNNIFNFGLEDIFKDALANFGQKLDEMYGIDPDAGLGNGGLGRLASCYLDAIAAQGMAGHGMSICYEYGIFKQKIENGKQIEIADDWLDLGDVWLLEKEEESKEVHFGGTLEENWENGKMKITHVGYTTVLAMPFDFFISGYDSEVVNTLRLFKATSPVGINMELFSQGKYLKALEEKHLAEVISKILYPEDAHPEGKILRLKQQYFFISAGLQTITRRHMLQFETLDNFHEKVAIHINDTHPSMAIPELMRIFIDEYGYEWDKAWSIVKQAVSYTNHTIMPEALEKWPVSLFKELLPRIYSIIIEIDRRLKIVLDQSFPDAADVRFQMAIIQDVQLNMANLCVAASHTVNGVSALHSRILQQDIFNGYYRLTPEKFTNVTNGIAYRRWLCQANPKLSKLISELCGTGFKKNAMELEKLLVFKDDQEVYRKLEKIKLENKTQLSNYILSHNNIMVDPDSIFDVQVKRLHEYKRQLLNLLHILYLYNRIQEDPNLDMQPRTFIFAAKAAAGYYMAKQIISLAYHLSQKINNDPIVKDRIKIVFLENYSVALSEIIMPAADVSEQISLAGKEASGTGNMKLMINGAVTIGTMDGANVEILEAVGHENIFIFGMGVEEVNKISRNGTYDPSSILRNNSNLSKAFKILSANIDGVVFTDIVNSLTQGPVGSADRYFILADFDSYRQAQQNISDAWQDRNRWNCMSLINIAKSGGFSADRSIKDYAARIWDLKPLRINGTNGNNI